MYKKGNVFDKSLFQYGTIRLLKSRVKTYQDMLEDVTKTQLTRIEGNRNLLVRILNTLNIEFTGDMIEFMGKAHSAGMDLSRIIGMTSNYGVGEIHRGTMYNGCDEIFIVGRNEDYMWTDLWNGWRGVAPLTVIDHPITELTYFMPSATNEAVISGGNDDRLCIFFLDISLLYIQWQMYKGSKRGASIEQYLTEIVYPNMMKSHMDIVMLNRVLMKLGIIEPCTVRSNLPFKQTPLDYEMDRVIDIVLKNYGGRRLEAELFISAIPGIFKTDISKSIDDPSLMPTIQSMWASLATKMKRVAIGLEMNKLGALNGRGYFLSRINRTIIQNESQKRFEVVKGGKLIQDRFDKYVTSRLPK